MRFLSAAGFGLLFIVLSSGCRCGGLENASGDLIDTLSERRLSLEFLYKPGLDLSRIGKPDWCRSPLTRLLCRDKCCSSCGNSCRSSGCQSAASCSQSCGSARNQVCTADCIVEKNVSVVQSIWKNKKDPTSETFFEELPSPEGKKEKQATR